MRNPVSLRKCLAVLASALLASCVSLSNAGREVQVVGSPDAVRHCRPLGYVSARTGLRGIAGWLYADERLDTQLRNKTARKGGNVLLLEAKEASVNDESHAYGTAYRCAT